MNNLTNPTAPQGKPPEISPEKPARPAGPAEELRGLYRLAGVLAPLLSAGSTITGSYSLYSAFSGTFSQQLWPVPAGLALLLTVIVELFKHTLTRPAVAYLVHRRYPTAMALLLAAASMYWVSFTLSVSGVGRYYAHQQQAVAVADTGSIPAATLPAPGYLASAREALARAEARLDSMDRYSRGRGSMDYATTDRRLSFREADIATLRDDLRRAQQRWQAQQKQAQKAAQQQKAATEKRFSHDSRYAQAVAAAVELLLAALLAFRTGYRHLHQRPSITPETETHETTTQQARPRQTQGHQPRPCRPELPEAPPAVTPGLDEQPAEQQYREEQDSQKQASDGQPVETRIRHLYTSQWKSYREIADALKIGQQRVSATVKANQLNRVRRQLATQVKTLLAQGHTTKAVARQLGIHEGAVQRAARFNQSTE